MRLLQGGAFNYDLYASLLMLRWHNNCATLCKVDKDYFVISLWTYNLQLPALFKIYIPK